MTAHDEATGATTVAVEFAGTIYTFPSSLDDADGDVIDAVDDMKLSHALRGLLSVDDWRRFKSTKPKVKDYAALFDAYAKRIGLVSAGE
jgi:hypothetical protein